MNLNTIAEVRERARECDRGALPDLPFTPDRIFSKLAEQP